MRYVRLSLTLELYIFFQNLTWAVALLFIDVLMFPLPTLLYSSTLEEKASRKTSYFFSHILLSPRQHRLVVGLGDCFLLNGAVKLLFFISTKNLLPSATDRVFFCFYCQTLHTQNKTDAVFFTAAIARSVCARFFFNAIFI